MFTETLGKSRSVLHRGSAFGQGYIRIPELSQGIEDAVVISISERVGLDSIESVSHVDTREVFDEDLVFSVFRFEDHRSDGFSYLLHQGARCSGVVGIFHVLFGDSGSSTDDRARSQILVETCYLGPQVDPAMLIKSGILNLEYTLYYWILQ